MRKNYQRKARKCNHKFEVVGGQELLVRVPLPIAEVWAEMQAQVEELAGKPGYKSCGPFWKTKSAAGWDHLIDRIRAPVVCAGASSQVMWSLRGRKFP